MPYQLSDIVTKVQQRVRDTGYSSTEITNYINDTQNDVFNEYALPFMQSTQDYTLTIDEPDITNGSGLPADYAQAITLVNTFNGNKEVIPYIDFTVLEEEYPDPEDLTQYPSGSPLYWYIYDQTIKVYPAPEQAYTVTLKYRSKPVVLSADADVPQIPSEFEELLVSGASYRVLQVKDNYDQAGIHQNKYDEILQKLVKRYSVPQTGSPLRMRIGRIRTSRHF